MMRVSRFLLQFVLTTLLSSRCLVTASSTVFSVTKDVKDEKNEVLGEIRYHYDSSISSCSFVIIIGVGTFMSVSDYDKLSEQISLGKPIVVVISDYNPGNFQKTSSSKYALLTNKIENEMEDLIPICVEANTEIVIGGHSASGQASLEAWQLDLLEMDPIGYVGLDPYEITEKTVDKSKVLTLPALFWGFTKTTCLVTKEKAAEAAYEITSPNSRVLYKIHNDNGCRITHCVFTDHGCGVRPLICSTQDEFDWVYKYVAKSIHLFLDAVHSGTAFNRDYFELHGVPEEDLTLYVNKDRVVSSKTKQLRIGSPSETELNK